MTVIYFAAIGTAPDVVTGDYCDLTVTEAITLGYREGEDGEEIEELGFGGPTVLDSTDLPIRTDDTDKLLGIEDAANDLLAAHGWRTVSNWELADNAAYAQVERTDDDTRSAYYEIEISDESEIWQTEHDDARGVETLDDDTYLADAARLILDNRIADLTADDALPAYMRVRVWHTQDDARAGYAPLAEAEHTPVDAAVTAVRAATRAMEEGQARLAADRARAVARLVDVAGSQSAAARALGISQPTINEILRRASRTDAD